MIYLERFHIPSSEQEDEFFWNLYDSNYGALPKAPLEGYYRLASACHNSVYPFHVFTAEAGFGTIKFEPITIFYGGNGTGKTTLLNVIAEKLSINRTAPFNRSRFYEMYLKYCRAYVDSEIPENSRIITSDDVFNYILDIRALNEGIDNKREELFAEYQKLKRKSNTYRWKSLEDYENYQKMMKIRKLSQSKYVKNEVGFNAQEHSNGENAFAYFTDKIKENALYLLDEPENSLSPARQLELVKFIEESARFYNCQFIISTHSPFLLALPYAKIYNLDERPVRTARWTELGNVRTYFDFFEQHRDEFVKGR